MPLDGAGADEQFGADFRVRSARESESRDVFLLRCELIQRVDSALADRLAGREQLASRGESIRANRVEHFVSRMQLLARFDSAALATQPLP